MPTTSRPGIGASMRIVRAASAIARSSARPSIRESFTRASGRTSYCVTTGPVFVATTTAGIWKLRSFSSMMRTFRTWSWRTASAVSVSGSRRVMRGSVHGRSCGSGRAGTPMSRSSPAAVASVPEADIAAPGGMAVGADAVARAAAPSDAAPPGARARPDSPTGSGPALHTVWLSGTGLESGVRQLGRWLEAA